MVENFKGQLNHVDCLIECSGMAPGTYFNKIRNWLTGAGQNERMSPLTSWMEELDGGSAWPRQTKSSLSHVSIGILPHIWCRESSGMLHMWWGDKRLSCSPCVRRYGWTEKADSVHQPHFCESERLRQSFPPLEQVSHLATQKWLDSY